MSVSCPIQTGSGYFLPHELRGSRKHGRGTISRRHLDQNSERKAFMDDRLTNIQNDDLITRERAGTFCCNSWMIVPGKWMRTTLPEVPDIMLNPVQVRVLAREKCLMSIRPEPRDPGCECITGNPEVSWNRV